VAQFIEKSFAEQRGDIDVSKDEKRVMRAGVPTEASQGQEQVGTQCGKRTRGDNGQDEQAKHRCMSTTGAQCQHPKLFGWSL
jgi:hypothetical protein